MEEILHHLGRGCIKLQQKMCLLVLVCIFGEYFKISQEKQVGSADLFFFSVCWGENPDDPKAAPSKGSYEPGYQSAKAGTLWEIFVLKL